MKKVFVTGGCGFVGSLLVPQLLKKYEVTVYDCMFFGNSFMPKDKKLKLINGDIRDIRKLPKKVRDLRKKERLSNRALEDIRTWVQNF